MTFGLAMMYFAAGLITYAWMWLSDRHRVKREPWQSIGYALIWPAIGVCMVHLLLTKNRITPRR